MKLATYDDGTLDGCLIIVSADLTQAVSAASIAPSLIEALRHWSAVEPRLRQLAADLDGGRCAGVIPFTPARCLAPLPRAPQWLDGSAFLNHGRLMDKAFDMTPIPDFDTIPVMYQGASDDFLSATADVPFVSEREGIDFEGEFGVILDDVAMATPAEQAASHIRLLVQINDWSLRGPGAREIRTGFGFLHAKPSTSFAPIAVTPDELGPAWSEGRVDLRLRTRLNDQQVGLVSGAEMTYSFPQLIAHAARFRRLTAGTIIGSGTVSNADPAAGSSCLAERRAIEKVTIGAPVTPYLSFGDRVTMDALFNDGRPAPFGTIDQQVVPFEVKRS